ncbi:helix-turn-helix transcriptional regulator [Vagococcus hydrophili]|nr:transcriptional regulator [Vagococcus hydrophili]
MNKIAGYRIMLGMTQDQMAKKFNISKQAYWKKEKRQTQFSDKEKMKFKEILKPLFPNITIDDIFFN